MERTIEKILTRVAAGLLPRHPPRTIWAGFGSGRPCDGGGEPIGTGEVEYELDFESSRTIRFHVACDGIWRAQDVPKERPAARR
jgi:hypothetical protein